MDSKMFCFQCEQTVGCSGCTTAGACGKPALTANLQDELTGALIGLARAVEKGHSTETTDRLVMEGLFTCITNVNFDDATIQELIDTIRANRDAIAPGTTDYLMANMWDANEDIRSLKSLVLFGIRGMAAYSYHAAVLGYSDKEVAEFYYRALTAVGNDTLGADVLLPLALEVGTHNFTVMGLLDKANTETFGTPTPNVVTQNVQAGPFVIITGHDLADAKQLLDQAKARGVNVYTHGEMLPAHGYPELAAYDNLKGNFGTAWQNQQKEFANVPAPIVFTTNCLMPPKASYSDRVFTTEVVEFPEMLHIDADDKGFKDFTVVLDKAIELGGYAQPTLIPGINGGDEVSTGFAHGFVLDNAGAIVEAVKAGDITHFFLVGGCDGARPGRNYYTDFVKATPESSIVLTLACGKFRFNDLNLGTIGAFPRLMDMGQCNDAFGAIQVAVALAEAFECGINELPLSMNISWYEQKAVCILLTLLSLGVKDIILGPTLPAFISPNVLNILVENYNIAPISTVEADMAKCLA